MKMYMYLQKLQVWLLGKKLCLFVYMRKKAGCPIAENRSSKGLLFNLRNPHTPPTYQLVGDRYQPDVSRKQKHSY